MPGEGGQAYLRGRRVLPEGKPERWGPTLIESRDVSRADEGRAAAGSVRSCGEFLGTKVRDAGTSAGRNCARGEQPSRVAVGANDAGRTVKLGRSGTCRAPAVQTRAGQDRDGARCRQGERRGRRAGADCGAGRAVQNVGRLGRRHRLRTDSRDVRGRYGRLDQRGDTAPQGIDGLAACQQGRASDRHCDDAAKRRADLRQSRHDWRQCVGERSCGVRQWTDAVGQRSHDAVGAERG
jgi:hypothetical protein